MRRRSLLTAGGLVVLFGSASCRHLPVIPKRPPANPADALSWIRFAQGRYTLRLPRCEMGQGIQTALRQVACDALGVPPHLVEVRLPSTRDIPLVRATVGSESVRDFAAPLAQACAALREAVAAGRSEGEIDLRGHAGAPLSRLLAERRWSSRAAPLEQGPAIVRGEALFAADVRRLGQRFGRVLRAPVSPELGAALQALDEGAARAVPGFIAVVRDPLLRQGGCEGVGIVAATPGALDRVEAALAPRWEAPPPGRAGQLDALAGIGAKLQAEGLRYTVHPDAVDRAGPWAVDLRLEVPLAAHGAIEPRAAVAEFAPDGALSVWAATQDPFYVRDVLARMLGLAEAQVVVHACRVGGAFGGKTVCTVELEAAVLARAVGAPVKVQWTRSQEFQSGFHRPPSVHRIRARLRNGRLDQWWHVFASSHILFTNAVVPPWLQRLTDLLGDDGVARGAVLPYRAAARRTEFSLHRLPVLTGPWRGLGAGPNVTAIECAIDECARAAGADPVAFRLDHIEDARLARVLRRVADAARWDSTAGAGGGRSGRGVACGIYKGASYAAVVAQVAVAPAGEVTVTHLWCAHDCGLLINPDQVRAQCEGNLVWGVGMVLTDGLRFDGSGITARSFADAPIPRLADVPPLDIELIDEGEPPGGAGETAIVAAAGAILNAVRAATGQRVTRLPIRAIGAPIGSHE